MSKNKELAELLQSEILFLKKSMNCEISFKMRHNFSKFMFLVLMFEKQKFIKIKSELNLNDFQILNFKNFIYLSLLVLSLNLTCNEILFFYVRSIRNAQRNF